MLEGHADAVLAHAHAALIASGTATLQATLAGLPHILVYRVAPATWAIGKALVHLDHLGLANIIAGETVTPELLQRDATPARMAQALGRLLDDGDERMRMIRDLSRVRARLGEPGAAERTAELILELLSRGGDARA